MIQTYLKRKDVLDEIKKTRKLKDEEIKWKLDSLRSVIETGKIMVSELNTEIKRLEGILKNKGYTEPYL